MNLADKIKHNQWRLAGEWEIQIATTARRERRGSRPAYSRVDYPVRDDGERKLPGTEPISPLGATGKGRPSGMAMISPPGTTGKASCDNKTNVSCVKEEGIIQILKTCMMYVQCLERKNYHSMCA